MSIEPLSALKNGEGAAGSVTKAIRKAARDVGLDFDLMLGVAKRESSLRADAKAATSSASGLFQFIDQTWLGAVKEHGEALGLGDYAKDITRAERGFAVADPARREEILNLRFKPEVAAKVAGKTLAAAKDRLTQALGREASGSEVYMAHFLGERGAVRMLNAGEDAVAADVDPRAAKANAPLFYKEGRPVTVAEFKGKIALGLGLNEQAPAPAEIPGPVQYTPSRPARPEAPVITYTAPSAQPASFSEISRQLPPDIFASIIDMQAEFIAGDARDLSEARDFWSRDDRDS